MKNQIVSDIWYLEVSDIYELKQAIYTQTLKLCKVRIGRHVTSLGHQVGRRVFWEGPKFFKLRPVVSSYVQHIFPGGAKHILGETSTLVTGLCI